VPSRGTDEEHIGCTTDKDSLSSSRGGCPAPAGVCPWRKDDAMDGHSDHSDIGKTLDHLRWLHDRLGEEVNRDRVRQAALLAYNAAAMLQLHLLSPVRRLSEVAAGGERRTAAEVSDKLLEETKRIYEELAAFDEQQLAGSPENDRCRRELRVAIDQATRQIPELLRLTSANPARERSLESNLDLAVMLRGWLNFHKDDSYFDRGSRDPGPDAAESSKRWDEYKKALDLEQLPEADPNPYSADMTKALGGFLKNAVPAENVAACFREIASGADEGFLRATAGLIAASSPEFKDLPPAARVDWGRLISACVADACDDAATRATGQDSERWRELGRALANSATASRNP